MEGLGLNGAAGAAAAAANSSSNANDGSSSSVPWWEKEEVDLTLIDRANAEAGAAHWKAWAVADDDSPFGAAGEEAEGQTAAAAATAAANAPAAAAAGGLGFGGLESSRGRWDYTVGLVGKPSAGKSTFYNAVIGE
jgi:hypothetical protein